MRAEETLEKSMEEKLAESNDKYLRLYAEYDNYRKRAQKEKEDLIMSTKSLMLSSILDMDNDISIALNSIDDKDPSREGVLLIASKVSNFLKSQNVQEIQTDTYDENLHEVISVVNTGEIGIVEVISKGYSIDNKILRYPKIILGK